MEITSTQIADVVTIDPLVHEDSRGFLMETWRADRFGEAGIHAEFVQEIHSRSSGGTLRGLHYQVVQPQGKLIRVIRGEIFDVAVDLRKSSPSFGQWVAETLTEGNRRLVFMPPGFAHGFLVTSDYADIEYRMTAYYAPQYERTLLWNDPVIGITWPLAPEHRPGLSARDLAGVPLADAEVYA